MRNALVCYILEPDRIHMHIKFDDYGKIIVCGNSDPRLYGKVLVNPFDSGKVVEIDDKSVPKDFATPAGFNKYTIKNNVIAGV